MEASRFDRLSRSFSAASSRASSRRDLLPRLAVTALGLGSLFDLESAAKKGKKKLVFNQFGCVDVGGKCRGKDKNCCSGICQGKKPKKSKKDKSRCVAHDETTCLPGQMGEVCGGSADVPCVTTTGRAGGCFTTTGNAGYCSAAGECFPCQKDADCILYCGAQAACITCATECAFVGVTACDGPEACSFP
jgi:hypothetical protein